MELHGICHKMHVGLTDLSVTDQNTQRANVEYKLILDGSEINLPFQLGQEIEIEWTGNIYCVSCGKKLLNHSHKATVLNVLKLKLHVICAS